MILRKHNGIVNFYATTRKFDLLEIICNKSNEYYLYLSPSLSSHSIDPIQEALK